MYFDKEHNKRKTLREAMEKGPVFAPCVFNPRTALIVEHAGFDAVCLSGGNFSASLSGISDIGLMTPTEIKNMVSNITKVASIPMIVDMDTGYGNELNAIRTAVDFAEAGAMALHFEDQVFPKRCGHLNGKRVIPREDYFKKIRAVSDALKGSDCLLIARTDSYLQYGVEEAIARNIGALENGADIAFTEGARTIKDIERIGHEVQGWNMFDMLHGGASPDVSFEDLIQMGYRLVTSPKSLHYIYTSFSDIAARARKECSDAFVGATELKLGRDYDDYLSRKEWLNLGKGYNPDVFHEAE